MDANAGGGSNGGQHLLALRFEEHRSHLRAVAYRMLGSIGEAEDAVQEAWLRLSRSDVSGVENLGGWLTTVVARRRVQGQAPAPDPDLARQREAVSAFFAATRDGDFDALLALLHPDVVLRSDGGVARAGHSVVLTGARTVGSQAALYSTLAPFVRPVLVNGVAGVVCVVEGRLMSVMAFTVTGDGRITAIDVLTDPDRLDAIDFGPFV